jgi:LmbE family N-acetylglucosaminyl deacetylase
MRRVLVVCPHPDDEAIGCGGILRRHVTQGDQVHVIFLTSGEQGGHGRNPEETLLIREQEAKDAARILGLTSIEFWRKPDGAFRVSKQVVLRLIEKVRVLKPVNLYVTHNYEMHSDHRGAFRLVRRALAEMPASIQKPAVLMFEVWTPIQRIDHIEDISDHIETKLAAVRAYRCQCNVLRFDEAIRGLNRFRGELHSWPGGDYAEIFMRLRI